VSIPLFIICAAILFISVWKSRANEKPPIWRKIDYSLLTVLIFCAVFLCVYCGWLSRHDALWLLLFSAAVYLTVMGFLAETAARIRDKQIVRSLYWLRFFKVYSLKRPIGLLMALLTTGNLIFLIVIFLATPRGIISAWVNIPLLLLSIFTLAALNYFCAFVLSLSSEYDKANADKIRAERFKVELITNVSHDIRTPLTSIINYVDLLKALPVEREDFTEYVAVLDKKSARLKTLISDLMEASKAATGNIAVNMEELDLAEIVGQIAGEFDDQFAERKLTFVFRQADEKISTHADSNHLWRVFENLFSNAAKYALPGTRVFAEISPRDGKAVMSLKNTSENPIDMASDSLTEQFIRGDRARQAEGNGLGLYIAKSLTEIMGGELTVKVSGDLFEAEVSLPLGEN